MHKIVQINNIIKMNKKIKMTDQETKRKKKKNEQFKN